MRGVVVCNQMQRLVLGRLAVDLAQELQPRGMRVSLLALTNDLTVQHDECRKQRCGAVALVVVRHSLRTPLLHRRSQLRAIQRLHLAFLVAAQYQGVLGWRHVQPYDVFKLFNELRVTRDLEASHDVRLQAIGLPVPHHGAGADAQLDAHLSRAPVRGSLGRGLRG